MKRSLFPIVLSCLAAALSAPAPVALAEDNTLTHAEKAAGWRLLFDGRSFDGWMCDNGKPIAAPI